MIEIRSYAPEDFAGVRLLWELAFPDDPAWNRAEAAVPAKLAVQPELFIVAHHGSELVGTVMAGYDGHRGWLYALAVSESCRREGVGSQLVHEAETRLKALGCGKLNLQVRATNEQVIIFYEKLGFNVEERTSMGRRL